jgi:two-component system sensor histidine kinase UhpB
MGRQLARHLRPAAIEDLGMTMAVRQLAADTTEASNIRVLMEFDEIDYLLSPQSHIMLYRVFQESLTNIMRHSGATEATLSARQEDGRILIEVRDNGQGMDLEKVESAREAGLGGLGLTTMTERVRTLGGSLEIWSQEGMGTRLSFSVPATERPER